VKIKLGKELSGILKIGFILSGNLKVSETPGELRSMIHELCEDIKNKYSKSSPSSIKGLEGAREIYKKIGIDPTKDRPSSEALFRRALKDQFPFINSLVDTINFCSLTFLFPYGLYDSEKIKDSIEIRIGKKGDGYETIGKGRINLEGKIVVCDELGPFGNPSADSRRASVSIETKSSLTLIFFRGGESFESVNTILNFTESMISRFHPESKTVSSGVVE
jgi:DNA/RNA-binding domain of Phe-tRNA-synthetase-like protein